MQHQFLSKYQSGEQSMSEYVTELRSDTGGCDFVSKCACKASIADFFLGAQFIRGIKDSSIREKLLQSEKITFDIKSSRTRSIKNRFERNRSKVNQHIK